MLKGLYSAASGMLSGLNRQTVLTHNLSNVNTAGFKQVMITMDEWKKTAVNDVVNINDQAPYLSSVYPGSDSKSYNYLGQLGLGVYNPDETIDFTQGPLETTNQPLDMAIQGDGFFRVRTPNGDRYTRDGRFQLDAANNLVTVDGFFVLDDTGNPIKLANSNVSIKTDGSLFVDGQSAGKLGVFSFTDPNVDLMRDENMFVAVGTPQTGTSQVFNNVLEGSNVDMTTAATQLLSISRSYESAQKLVTQQDSILNKTISSLGNY
ncbi:MAG: flagellar hook-basal body protein [Anaerolineae bacterium]|nr:flagellar hook-basal body protein [Anaerolineae bacterium]